MPLGDKFYPESTKLGAGGYPAGSPVADPHGGSGSSGGGAGCHFEPKNQAIDQTDAINGIGQNIVMNYHCQCNSAAFGQDWNLWVDTWLKYAKNKPGFDYQGWFGKGKAPSWGGDIAACWMSNPRDMINLQNALWFRRFEWNNQKAPVSNWQGNENPSSNRPYWGWNEVPVDKQKMKDPGNWDAIVIKLPPGVCDKSYSNDDTVVCLSQGAQQQLESDLGKFISAGYLVPGADKYSTKPGSSVVFVREIMDVNGNYFREFYCEPWTTPNNKYDIDFVSDKGPGPEGAGSCYIQYHSASAIFV